MTGAALPRPAGRARRLARWRLTAAFVLLVAGLAVWIGGRGLLARGHLIEARALLVALERDVTSGRPLPDGDLERRAGAVQREAQAARRLTGDPIWIAAAALPGAGCPLRSTRTLVGGVDELATDALPPLVATRGQLDPAAVASGLTVRLAPLAAAREPLTVAESVLRRTEPQVAAATTCGAVGRALGLPAARTELLTATRSLTTRTAAARLAATLAPPMLGAEEPRRYLLVVQNDAESRATGGIIGALGVLEAEEGRVRLTDLRGNDGLPLGPRGSVPDTDVDPDFMARYGRFDPAATWGNANLSPDYPTGARLFAGLYEHGTGTRVDGVVAVDPTTLGYLVSATRPARLPDGRTVTGQELAGLTQSKVYAAISDPGARDAFFVAVGAAAYDAVGSGAGSPAALLNALGRAAAEGRLLVWSSRPGEQQELATTAIGGGLPATPGPFLAVVTQNAAASKLDYWLRRRTDYQLVRRPDGGADVTVTVTVTNTAPAGLPAYVRLRQDPGAPPGNPEAQTKLWVSVYTGVGSGFVDATLDGVPVPLGSEVEQGHPVASSFLTLDAGQTRTLELRVREPISGPAVTVRPQPLVSPELVTVTGAVRRSIPEHLADSGLSRLPETGSESP